LASGHATYLYCLLRRARAPDLSRAPTGLPGLGRPRALDAGKGLWLIAADAPLALFGEAVLERGLRDLQWVSARALPHEAMVEHAARGGPVLPMRLFTLFRGDERALAHVRGERRRIDRVLERVAGREEWGARVLLDERRALVAARARAAKEAGKAARAAGGNRASAGLSFLTRKKAEQELAARLLATARAAADALFDELSARSDDARRRPPPPGEVGKRALLDGAFLVKASKGRAWNVAAARRAKSLAALGLVLEVTGPWPPYNFLAVGA
jgi:hypothetical protein